LTRLVPRPLQADPEALPHDWHPVVRRVLAARGISHRDELDHGLHRLASPRALAGCDEAAERIAGTLREGGRILVLGDFDADGATSCAVAVRGLRAMGATDVDYLVPDRFAYGYGLSPAIADVAVARAPDLVITVDNGITSHAGVAAVQAAGIPVIVTDHHLPGDELPPAAAIVNPNRAGDAHPGKALAGVGVIFHVMLQVRAVLRDQGWFGTAGEPGMAALLDLVALGTIADLVALDATNRILAEQGLRRIRSGAANAGIRALLAVAGRDAERVNAADLGFAVAPRLNAAGRLEDIGVGIECLITDDIDRASALAQRLDELNRERRSIEGRMRDEAIATVEALRERLGGHAPPAGICLHSDDWHEGVVGLVAGRVKEHFHRPVVALAPSEDATRLKGSARSIPGVHMRDLLAMIDARHPAIIDGRRAVLARRQPRGLP
jgi:single-stranded-DNA-specific exonuclease